PRVLDSSLVELSRIQIERFLKNKGYVDVRVADSIVIKKNRRAHIDFFADPGSAFHIRQWSQHLDDHEVAMLYQQWRHEHTYMKQGIRNDADRLGAEREYIYQKMKQHGHFDFLRQYIHFEVDSGLQSALADVTLRTEGPPDRA